MTYHHPSFRLLFYFTNMLLIAASGDPPKRITLFQFDVDSCGNSSFLNHEYKPGLLSLNIQSLVMNDVVDCHPSHGISYYQDQQHGGQLPFVLASESMKGIYNWIKEEVSFELWIDTMVRDSVDKQIHEGVIFSINKLRFGPPSNIADVCGSTFDAQLRMHEDHLQFEFHIPSSANSGCVDNPDFKDIYGDDCSWYDSQSICDSVGELVNDNGGTAKQNCCICGGGSLTFTNTSTKCRTFNFGYSSPLKFNSINHIVISLSSRKGVRFFVNGRLDSNPSFDFDGSFFGTWEPDNYLQIFYGPKPWQGTLDLFAIYSGFVSSVEPIFAEKMPLFNPRVVLVDKIVSIFEDNEINPQSHEALWYSIDRSNQLSFDSQSIHVQPLYDKASEVLHLQQEKGFNTHIDLIRNYTIHTLPNLGLLFQNDGSPIQYPPTVLSDSHRFIYIPPFNVNSDELPPADRYMSVGMTLSYNINESYIQEENITIDIWVEAVNDPPIPENILIDVPLSLATFTLNEKTRDDDGNDAIDSNYTAKIFNLPGIIDVIDNINDILHNIINDPPIPEVMIGLNGSDVDDNIIEHAYFITLPEHGKLFDPLTNNEIKEKSFLSDGNMVKFVPDNIYLSSWNESPVNRVVLTDWFTFQVANKDKFKSTVGKVSMEMYIKLYAQSSIIAVPLGLATITLNGTDVDNDIFQIVFINSLPANGKLFDPITNEEIKVPALLSSNKVNFVPSTSYLSQWYKTSSTANQLVVLSDSFTFQVANNDGFKSTVGKISIEMHSPLHAQPSKVTVIEDSEVTFISLYGYSEKSFEKEMYCQIVDVPTYGSIYDQEHPALFNNETLFLSPGSLISATSKYSNESSSNNFECTVAYRLNLTDPFFPARTQIILDSLLFRLYTHESEYDILVSSAVAQTDLIIRNVNDELIIGATVPQPVIFTQFDTLSRNNGYQDISFFEIEDIDKDSYPIRLELSVELGVLDLYHYDFLRSGNICTNSRNDWECQLGSKQIRLQAYPSQLGSILDQVKYIPLENGNDQLTLTVYDGLDYPCLSNEDHILAQSLLNPTEQLLEYGDDDHHFLVHHNCSVITKSVAIEIRKNKSPKAHSLGNTSSTTTPPVDLLTGLLGIILYALYTILSCIVGRNKRGVKIHHTLSCRSIDDIENKRRGIHHAVSTISDDEEEREEDVTENLGAFDSHTNEEATPQNNDSKHDDDDTKFIAEKKAALVQQFMMKQKPLIISNYS